MVQAVLEPLDDGCSFVEEDREGEISEKTSPFARKKRAIVRSFLRKKKVHREDVLPVRPRASRRNEEEEGIEVDSTFFWSPEEVERRQAMGNVKCAARSYPLLASPMKAHHVHTHHRPHLSRMGSLSSILPVDSAMSEEMSPDNVSLPDLTRQDTHLSLATQETQETVAAADDDDEDNDSRLRLDEHASRARIRRSKTMRTKAALQKRFLQKLAYSQRADLSPEEREAALVEALATTHIGFSDNEHLRETEEIWENQRGFVFFGLIKFSQLTRLWGDPPTWTRGDHRPSPYTKMTVPLPDPRWEWSTAWLIDMRLPCDPDGWQYCWRYAMDGWHAYPSWRNSFVRRRRWVRERRLAGKLSAAAAQDPNPKFDRPRDFKGQSPALEHHEAPAHVTAGPPPSDSDLLAPLPLELALDILHWSKRVPSKWPFASYRQVQRIASQEVRGADAVASREQMASWRDAVIIVSFRRLERILGPCQIDRERLDFWTVWLDGPPEASLGEMSDCWDLLEARIDDTLAMFEYQEARVALMHRILEKLAQQRPSGTGELIQALHPHGEQDDDMEYGLRPRVNFIDYCESLLESWKRKFGTTGELPFKPVPTPVLLAEAPAAESIATPYFLAPTSKLDDTPFFEALSTPLA